MKSIVILFLSFFIGSLPGWLTNFDEAQKLAAKDHKLILLNFSGSDWCGPCIRLKKEVFESAAFGSFTDSTGIILVNADFPRNSKNKLSKEQVKHNESLADKYNAGGKFPFTLLLNADGKVLKEWDGFPDAGPAGFIEQLKIICHNNN